MSALWSRESLGSKVSQTSFAAGNPYSKEEQECVLQFRVDIFSKHVFCYCTSSIGPYVN